MSSCKKRLSEEYSNNSINKFLKGQCHEIFDFRIFPESVSPRSLSIPLGHFKFFQKLAEAFAALGAPPVSLKWKKSSIRKVLIIF